MLLPDAVHTLFDTVLHSGCGILALRLYRYCLLYTSNSHDIDLVHHALILCCFQSRIDHNSKYCQGLLRNQENRQLLQQSQEVFDEGQIGGHPWLDAVSSCLLMCPDVYKRQSLDSPPFYKIIHI